MVCGRHLERVPGPVSDDGCALGSSGQVQNSPLRQTRNSQCWYASIQFPKPRPPGPRSRRSAEAQGGDYAAMSEDYWDDAVHNARWVAQWRELQREAFDIALEMSDANAHAVCRGELRAPGRACRGAEKALGRPRCRRGLSPATGLGPLLASRRRLGLLNLWEWLTSPAGCGSWKRTWNRALHNAAHQPSPPPPSLAPSCPRAFERQKHAEPRK
jgi:hypothetical protein